MFRSILLSLLVFVTVSCAPKPTASPVPIPPTSTLPPPTSTVEPASPTPTFPPSETPTPTPVPLVPNFRYIVIVVFENKEFGFVIGNSRMPAYNRYASDYATLTQYYAVTHPSLPNYIAMISGDTQGITSNCEDCFVNATSLPDLIEASGRAWRTYQEDMPFPCFVGSKVNYVQKHNPFIYFDPIRLDAARCERTIVPLSLLPLDLAVGLLPNFVFITPNLCNSAHDCGLDVADGWLANLMSTLQPALDATGEPYLIVLTWDEGQGNHSCCGLPAEAGGRVATVLISPQVKNGFQDDTPYSHYSLLKTIAEAWGLPYLGHAADELTSLIVAPWK
ncbi:MAG: alkaline phosphatase family protein [Chloroflexota bacterium]